MPICPGCLKAILSGKVVERNGNLYHSHCDPEKEGSSKQKKSEGQISTIAAQ